MPVPEEFRRRFGAAIKRSVEPIAKNVQLYEAGAEIVPGLTTIAAAGHTPGMVSFLVHSGRDQLLLTADLAYHPVVNIDRPWRPGPDRATRTPRSARANASSTVRLPTVFPFSLSLSVPGLGHLLRTDSGYAGCRAGWQF